MVCNLGYREDKKLVLIYVKSISLWFFLASFVIIRGYIEYIDLLLRFFLKIN